MKLQKNIIICSFVLMILSIVGIIFLNAEMKIYDICVGVFTGVILTLLTTIILYNYEKKKLLNKLYSNFSEIYFILCFICQKLGKFLDKKDITNVEFSLNYKLATEISDSLRNLVNVEYTSFFDRKLDKQMENFTKYVAKLYNLKNIIEARNINILNFEIEAKEGLLNNQLSEKKKQLLIEYREEILIAIGRLHEYSCSLKIELDEIMTEFCNCCKICNKWQDEKNDFEKEVEAKKNDL